jgi:hypothetical protein
MLHRSQALPNFHQTSLPIIFAISNIILYKAPTAARRGFDQTNQGYTDMRLELLLLARVAMVSAIPAQAQEPYLNLLFRGGHADGAYRMCPDGRNMAPAKRAKLL